MNRDLNKLIILNISLKKELFMIVLVFLKFMMVVVKDLSHTQEIVEMEEELSEARCMVIKFCWIENIIIYWMERTLLKCLKFLLAKK